MRVRIQSKNGYKEINLNRRKAIRERCLNCSAWSYKAVENCERKDCHLHPFRMGTGKQDAQKRHKAIRNFCLFDCCVGIQDEVYKCPSKDCSLYAFRKSSIDRSVEISPNEKVGHIQ